jgi:serine/threonine protein kinase
VPAERSEEDDLPISGAVLGRPSSAQLRTTVLPRQGAPGVAPRFRRVADRAGDTSLVEDRDLERRVVVQRLRAERRHGHALVRFADRARLIGGLEHPGIVPLHDVGVDEDGSHYAVLKHVEGETLEIVIKKLRDGDRTYAERFGLASRLRIFAALAETVSFLHSRGVLHRDLRPENVIVGDYGEVTIVDFGIAKVLGAREPRSRERDELASVAPERLVKTQLGELVGTPRYMSPEQAAGRDDELDARSDVFALGLILAELLTLEHPLAHKQHENEVLAELVARGVDMHRLEGRARALGIPIELRRLLGRALEHDRRKRYGSVALLLADLRRIQDGRVSVRCHVTLFKRLAYESMRWVDRNPGAYTLIFTLAALALLGGAVYACCSSRAIERATKASSASPPNGFWMQRVGCRATNSADSVVKAPPVMNTTAPSSSGKRCWICA